MQKLDYRNIEKDPARCGGQPVVVGTRIRVATILTCYRQGMGVEEIVQQYPHLKPADVHDALAYAHDHLDEIEADLAADDEAAVKAKYGLAEFRWACMRFFTDEACRWTRLRMPALLGSFRTAEESLLLLIGTVYWAAAKASVTYNWHFDERVELADAVPRACDHRPGGPMDKPLESCTLPLSTN